MVSRSSKRLIAAGAVALVLGAAALGVASAQQAPNGQGQNRYEQFVTALAARLNVSPDTLKQDIAAVRQEQGWPAGPRGWVGPHGPRGFGLGLDAAAKALNIAPAQLRTELQGKTLTDVAKAHNVDPKTVSDALKQAATGAIDQAVKDGKLTSDRANQMKSNLDQRIATLMTRTHNGGPGNGGGMQHRGPGADLGAAATALNLTPAQLRQELAGKALTDVAKAHNVDPNTVAAALKQAATERIDLAVTDGRLTSDQASQMKSGLDQKISALMTRTFPSGQGNGPGPRGHHGRGQQPGQGQGGPQQSGLDGRWGGSAL